MNYVDDVIDALLIAGASHQCYGQIFNLGSNESINLLNLVKLLIEINGSGEFEIIPFPEDKKRIDIGDYYANHSKFTDFSGWHPQTSLREGFSKMMAYYKQNLDKYIDN